MHTARLLPQEAPDDQTVLYANRVEKVFPNGVRALDELKLRIQKGDFVSLVGPSGCGKSTLLRMFAGLDEPSAGHVSWWGKTQMPHGEEGRTFSMVFQDSTLMPWATAEANVRLPLDLAGVPKSQSTPRIEKALESVGLSRFGGAYPRELSGGMQMRTAIARALVTEPNLLLMDEPFGALDEFTRNRLDQELRELWANRDVTVVFVTHSIYEAVFLSTKVAVMAASPGRILAEVEIDGPAHRDEAFRMSTPFMEMCKQLSELLGQANALGRDAKAS